MVADVGVLARALNPNGLLGKGRIYFYDRSTESVAKKKLDFQFLKLIFKKLNRLTFFSLFKKSEKNVNLFYLESQKKWQNISVF